MDSGDRDLVSHSWLHSYGNDKKTKRIRNHIFWQFLDRKVFFGIYNHIIDRILERSYVLIACDPTNSSEIMGWVCFEKVNDDVNTHLTKNVIVHYIYVKEPFRHFGIAHKLWDAVTAKGMVTVITHQTPRVSQLVSDMGESVNYRPMKAFE